jgi:hypothetical protein
MVCGDINYCTEKQNCYDDKHLKQPNRCKLYAHNPIDALWENKKGYMPRKKKNRHIGETHEQLVLRLFGSGE